MGHLTVLHSNKNKMATSEDSNHTHIDHASRLAVIEEQIKNMHTQIKTNSDILKDLQDTHTKMKTLIGAISVVISGIWLVLTTFKETVISWLTGK